MPFGANPIRVPFDESIREKEQRPLVRRQPNGRLYMSERGANREMGIFIIVGAFESATAIFKARLAALAAMLVLLFLGIAAPASAVCTAHGTVNPTSTQLLAAKDTGNPSGNRWFLWVQNSGIDTPMWLAIGSGNQATTSDIEIAPGDHFSLISPPNYAVVPGGDVAAIAANGGSTSYVVCDY